MLFNYTVPVGTPVHYFRQALDSLHEPVAAILTNINDEGVADIVEIPRFGGTMAPKCGVRYVEDPWHKVSPDVSRNYGAWGFIPEVKEIETKKKPIPELVKGGK